MALYVVYQRLTLLSRFALPGQGGAVNPATHYTVNVVRYWVALVARDIGDEKFNK